MCVLAPLSSCGVCWGPWSGDLRSAVGGRPAGGISRLAVRRVACRPRCGLTKGFGTKMFDYLEDIGIISSQISNILDPLM